MQQPHNDHATAYVVVTRLDVEGTGLVEVHEVVVEGEGVLHVRPRPEPVLGRGLPLCSYVGMLVGLFVFVLFRRVIQTHTCTRMYYTSVHTPSPK